MEKQLLCLLEGQAGGVTQIQFTPDGSFLLAGGRKDNEILVWDLRNPGELLAVLQRIVQTNQRIQFDVKESMVLSGGSDGGVLAWDLTSTPREEDKVIPPVLRWRDLHGGDCVNGVTFNPHHNVFASSSGQRHFSDPCEQFSPDEDGEEKMDESESSGAKKVDNSVKVWAIIDRGEKVEEASEITESAVEESLDQVES